MNQKTTNCIKSPSINVDLLEQKIINKVATFILSKRNEKKLSMREVSRRSNVSMAVLTELENGNSLPRIRTLIKITLALGIDINDIFEIMTVDLSDNKKRNSCNVPTKTNLASTIRSFGYNKKMINEIMDFIDYVEHKYLTTLNKNNTLDTKKI